MHRDAARPLIGLFLALTLAVASVTLAQARAQSHGLHATVICSGAGSVTILLDANGQPAGPPLPCPDCIAGLAAALPCQPTATPDRPRPTERLTLPRRATHARALPPVYDARGPPAAV